MTTSIKLLEKHIQSITQKLTKPVQVNGLINESDENTRLYFLFETSNLYDAISQVLFNKVYDIDEVMNNEETNTFNLYKLFFEGIGDSYFFFNESSLIEDIRESKTLNDYCQHDHAYQENAIAKGHYNYKKRPYAFSCDYWIRYINKSHELIYATVRSADMDLYWLLEELSRELVEQAIPHSIDIMGLDDECEENKEETTPVKMTVNAHGKEQQLKELESFCRDSIKQLTEKYHEQLTTDSPSISMRLENDHRNEQYFIFVVNNEQAANQIELRKFESSFVRFDVPKVNIHQQHEQYLQSFTELFEEKLKSLNVSMRLFTNG